MQLLSGFELARSRLHPGQPNNALTPSRLPRQLQSVPRWVYALLQGPLLASHLASQVKAALSKGSKSVWAGAGGVGLASDGGDVTRRADDYFNKRGPK